MCASAQGTQQRTNLVAASLVRSARHEKRVHDLVRLRAFGRLKVSQV